MNNAEYDKESEKKSRKIFNFFLNHYEKKTPFAYEELANFVDYDNLETFNTYYSKKLQDLVVINPNNPSELYISDIFKLYSRWETFSNLISQRARLRANYTKYTYKNVIIYELYMPMTNERILKSCLDNLFYKDTLKFKLKTISLEVLKKIVPYNNLTEDEYIDNLCKWISNKFCGYSIETVFGRFRFGDEILSFSKAGDVLSKGKDYLLDETTAIVRFIFPIEPPSKINNQIPINNFVQITKEEINDQKKKIWFFFEKLFVESILEIVNGEDEIWLLERGLKRNNLYKWKS
ncbi:MAG: hypothetical protein ACFFDF_08415 [Candidatus Odinarchaeota archaeon]